MVDRPELIPHRRLNLAEARRLLEMYDDNVPNAQADPQKETRDKLEWAINNAEKLNVLFRGALDKQSINDVEHYMILLGMRFPPNEDPFKATKTSTLH
jgi:hypothetical protein